MHGTVHQRTAAFVLIAEPRTARAAPPSKTPDDRRANGTGLDDVLELAPLSVKATHKANGQSHVGLAASIRHAPRVSHLQRHGLLAEDVLAGFGCGDDWGGVLEGGGADPHRVDLGQVEQRSEVCEVVFGPEVAGERFSRVGDDIRGRDNARTPNPR